MLLSTVHLLCMSYTAGSAHGSVGFFLIFGCMQGAVCQRPANIRVDVAGPTAGLSNRRPARVCCSEGFAVAQLVEALRYKPEGQGFDSFRLHYGAGVDSASNK